MNYDTYCRNRRRPDWETNSERYSRMATFEEYAPQLTDVPFSSTEYPPGTVMYKHDGHYYVDEDVGSYLYVGGTGSGKSTLLKSNLHYWSRTKCPVVVSDPSGEFFASCAAEFENNGYTVQQINLQKLYRGIRFDPTDEIKKGLFSDDIEVRDKAESNLAHLLESLIVRRDTNQMEWSVPPYFFCKGLFKELVERAGDDYRVTLSTIVEAANRIVPYDRDLEKFADTIEDDNPNKPDLDAVMGVKSATTRAGHMMNLNSGLGFCNSRGMRDIMSANDLDIHAIARGEPIALFILSPDYTSIYDDFVNMLLEQILYTLIDDADNIYGQELPRQVLLVMDEFTNFPAIPDFHKKVTTIRKRNIRLNIAVQSMSQIFFKYGDEKAKTIIGNCKAWFCTRGDSSFFEQLKTHIGTDASGEPIITHNMLRCLKRGEPLVSMHWSSNDGSDDVYTLHPFITKIDKPDIETRQLVFDVRPPLEDSKIDLDTLLFHPEMIGKGVKVSPDALDDDEIPADFWTSEHDSDPEASSPTGSNDYLGTVATSTKDLIKAVFEYALDNGIYKGQEIKVESLKELQELTDEKIPFGDLMDLVEMLVEDYSDEAMAALCSTAFDEDIPVKKISEIRKHLKADLGFIREKWGHVSYKGGAKTHIKNHVGMSVYGDDLYAPLGPDTTVEDLGEIREAFHSWDDEHELSKKQALVFVELSKMLDAPCPIRPLLSLVHETDDDDMALLFDEVPFRKGLHKRTKFRILREIKKLTELD